MLNYTSHPIVIINERLNSNKGNRQKSNAVFLLSEVFCFHYYVTPAPLSNKIALIHDKPCTIP